MHKSATKCNETIGKWCKNKHGASKIIDTFETYQWLRLELKPTIKRLPLRVAKGGIGKIENIKTESLSAVAGGDWRGETPSESPLEGSSIPPTASPLTPPSISAPLHHHLLQDLIIPTVISWQTLCMTQYTRFPWSIVFLCPCLSSNLLLAIVKFFLDWLHTSLLSSMMVLCTDIWVHTYVGGCIRLSPLHVLTGGWTDGVQKPCSNPRCLLC
jgi:hypothetical protein